MDMIRGGFLSAEDRKDLIELARNGSAEHRLARRANALILLDKGWSCESVGQALLVDDDTVRTWFRLFQEDGVGGLVEFGYKGSTSRLTVERQEKLRAWIGETLPRTTREVGAWIESEFGVSYQSRSGLVFLLRRLGVEHRKPVSVSSKLDETKQEGFIGTYQEMQKKLPDDEVIMFADAVHPTHAARPTGCWAPKEIKVAVNQTSGRQRLNIHGAIDLVTGLTKMIEVVTVNAQSTIALLFALELFYPNMRVIHVFLDNARYHHAKMVREWLALPGRRIKLHFIPAYCPHLNPIERLWRLMHKHITHNKCYTTYNKFCEAMLGFLREKVPKNWSAYCDDVSDNFRIISPKDFRILR